MPAITANVTGGFAGSFFEEVAGPRSAGFSRASAVLNQGLTWPLTILSMAGLCLRQMDDLSPFLVADDIGTA
jgi:hypothetical protein